jgi:hypothetical protein
MGNRGLRLRRSLQGALKALTKLPPEAVGINERLMIMPEPDRAAAIQRIVRRTGFRWQGFVFLVMGLSLPFIYVRLRHPTRSWTIFFDGIVIIWLISFCIIRRLRTYSLRSAILEEFPNYCAGCGYDCQSSIEVCPECGRPRTGTTNASA